MRRDLPDRIDRSERIWARVRSVPGVIAAKTVMVFESVSGEPITAPFVAWCEAHGKIVVLPDNRPDASVPADPERIDVAIVPGVAFTGDGDRLGQGGGWYDRVLCTLRPDCLTIGVGFAPQIVDRLPVEPHDVRLHLIVTDADRTGPSPQR